MKTFQEVEGVKSVDNGYWKNKENRRKAYEYAKKALVIKDTEDWYKVKASDLKNIGLSSLISREYCDSWKSFLIEFNPDFEFVPWKFIVTPSGYWKNKENRRKAYEYAKKALAIKDAEDWYKVKASDLKDIGLSSLIAREYCDSWKSFLVEFNPDFEFVPRKFIATPNGYWKNKENRRKAYEYAKKALAIKDPEDWYKVKASDLNDLGLSSLISREYCDSWKSFLVEFNPDFEFVPWKFINTPNGYWKNKENLRKYFEWLATIKEFTSIADFYSLKASDLIRNYGSSLISQKPYLNLIQLIKLAFPEYDWVMWKFARVPSGFWESKANQRMYLLWLFNELKLKFPNEAAELNKSDFINNYGATLVYDQTITEVLQNAFETYDWISIVQNCKSSHDTLVTYVSELLSTNPALKKCSRILHYLVNENLSINCYVPELRLGFQLVKSKDQWESIRDSTICQSRGINLIQLPEGLVITKKMIKRIMLRFIADLKDQKELNKISSKNTAIHT